jgi:hypothetical protein
MIEKLCGRIEEYRIARKPMPMQLVYMCLTTDIITLYAFNRSWNNLDSADLAVFWHETIKQSVKAGHFLKQFPFLFTVIRALPEKIVGLMNPGLLMLMNFEKVLDASWSV